MRMLAVCFLAIFLFPFVGEPAFAENSIAKASPQFPQDEPVDSFSLGIEWSAKEPDRGLKFTTSQSSPFPLSGNDFGKKEVPKIEIYSNGLGRIKSPSLNTEIVIYEGYEPNIFSDFLQRESIYVQLGYRQPRKEKTKEEREKEVYGRSAGTKLIATLKQFKTMIEVAKRDNVTQYKKRINGIDRRSIDVEIFTFNGQTNYNLYLGDDITFNLDAMKIDTFIASLEKAKSISMKKRSEFIEIENKETARTKALDDSFE